MIKRSSLFHLLTGLACFTLAPGLLLSLPQEAQTSSGTAEFTQSDPSTLVISTSDKAIINYKSFDIAKQEKVKFLQPSNSSTVLNRVKGKDPSKIFGNLESNGRVLLVNPKGVYFSPSATVNVGSLIVSTLNIEDGDFLEDRFQFSLGSGTADSAILNQGLLSASSEGSIVLLAPKIRNEGIIEAKAGKVLLAAGEAVTLDFSGDGLLSFSVKGELKEAVIEHLGNIQAPDGDVYLKLGVAEKAIKSIVKADKIERGVAFVEEEGVIRLVSMSMIKAKNIEIAGSQASHVTIEGELNASDLRSGAMGGSVSVVGEHVQIEGARINASGDQGGGSVLIGGNYQGKGELFRSQTSTVDSKTTIYADAVTQGDGGQVVLWSDGTTLFEGSVFARGGKLGGQGGHVETSGKEKLQVLRGGSVNTLAPQGQAGEWLLDPPNIIINTVGGGSLANAENCAFGSDVTILPSDIVTGLSSGNVTLCATTSITLAASSNIVSTTANTLTFQASGGDITTTLNSSITTAGGQVVFNGVTGSNLNAVVLGTTGITINTTGSSSAGASVSFNSTIDGAQALVVTAGTGTVTFTGAVGATPLSSLSASGATIIQGSTVTTTGGITYTGTSAINISGNLTTSSGAIGLTGPVVLQTASLIFSTVASGAGANISFNSTLNGSTASTDALTLTAGTGTVLFSGNVGGSTPLTNLLFTGTTGPIDIGGNIIMSGANSLTFPNAVVLTGGGTTAISFTSVNQSITFSSTLNALSSGVQSLTATTGTGTVTFTGAVGATPLGSLSASGATIIQGSTVTTTGGIAYTGTSAINISGNLTTSSGAIGLTGPVVLQTASLTFSTAASGSGANISFNSTLNGSTASTDALTLTAGTGTVLFSGNVGGSTPLTNLLFTGTTGPIDIGGNIVMSGANSLTFPNAVVLTGGGTTAISFTSVNQSITFSSTLNALSSGVQSLTATAGTGTVTFTGAVGATPLGALSASGATITQGSTVTTTGGISYTGTTAINVGGNLTTSGGTVIWNNPATLTAAVTINTTSGAPSGNNITLGTVNGAFALALNAGSGGTAQFGAIGSNTALTSLGVTAATITQSSTVKTTGGITYTGTSAIDISGNLTTNSGAIGLTGPVVLETASLTFSTNNSGGGANISFNSTLDGSAVSTDALTLTAGTGTVLFSGNVGGSTPLTNLLFTGTTGPIDIGGNIVMSGANSLTFPNAVVLTGGGITQISFTSVNQSITFGSTLNALSSGVQSLIATAGTGTVTFTGAVGATPLGALVASGATIIQSSTATTTGGIAYTGTTAIDIGGNLTTSSGAIGLTGPVVLQTASLTFSTVASGTGANISFNSTLNGSTASTDALTLTAGTGTVIFSGNVGGSTPLTNLLFTGTTGPIDIGGNIVMSGANPLTFPSIVILTGGGTTQISFTSVNQSVTFGSTIGASSSGALQVVAGTGTVTFTGAVGTSPLSALSASGATIIQDSTVSTTGSITYTGTTAIDVGGNLTTSGGAVLWNNPATLTAAVTIDTTNGGGVSAGNNITLGTVNGAFALALNAGSGGTAQFGAIGSNTALASLNVTAATITQSSTAKTTGGITYTGTTAIDIGGNLTTNSGAISLTGPVVLETASLTFSTNNSGGGANISFNSSLDGSAISTDALTLTAGTGTVLFSGNVGGSTPLTNLLFTGTTGPIQIGGSITMSGANPLNFPRPVVLTGGGTTTISFTSVNQSITFGSTLNALSSGAPSLIATAGTGTVIFTGAVGTTPLNSLSVSGATITQGSTVGAIGPITYTGTTAINVGGNLTTRGGIVTWTGPATLTAATTIDTTNGGGSPSGNNITLGTVDGAFAFVLNAGSGGTAQFGAIGSNTTLASLSVTAETIIQNSTVKTTGGITYTGTSAINVDGNLTTSSGAISMTGPVVLETSPLTFSTVASGSGANISFNSTLDGSTVGADALTLTVGTGTVLFSGNVGGSTPLTNLVFTGTTGPIQIGGNITMSGANPLTFPNAVVLTGAGTTTISFTSVNQSITFGSTVNALTSGVQSLVAIAGTGTITFTGAIGVTTLGSLAASGATITQGSTARTVGPITYTGTTAINIGGNLTTTSGIVTWNNPATLTANVTIDTTNNAVSTGANIVLNNINAATTGTGAQSLTLRADNFSGGGSIILGALGDTKPLGKLTIPHAASVTVNGDIIVEGDATAGGTISISPAVILGTSAIFTTAGGGATAGNNIMLSKVDATTASTSAESLTLNAGTAGVITVGALGSNTPLGLLTIPDAASITTSGNITIRGDALAGGTLIISQPVVLAGRSSLTFTTTGGGATAGNTISLNSVDATTPSILAETLTLDAGTAGVVSIGIIGGNVPLGLLTISQASVVQAHGNITIEGNALAGGTLTISQPLVLAGGSSLVFTTTGNNTAAGNAISLNNVDATTASTSAEALTLDAGTQGVVSLGTIGGNTPLGLLTISGAIKVVTNGNITIRGDAIAGGTLEIFQPLVLGNSVTFSTTGGGYAPGNEISLHNVSGPFDLTLNAGLGTISLQDSMGPMGIFSITSAGTINATSIVATSMEITGSGTATFYGALTATGKKGITVNTGPIFLANSINAKILSLTAHGSILNLNGINGIHTGGYTLFNAIGGDVGTLSSPIMINTSFVITVGADPAYFTGTPFHACVDYLPSNPPAFVLFRGLLISSCSSSPVLGPRDFYVQGIYSSWDNLSNYYYFVEDRLSREQMQPREHLLFVPPKRKPLNGQFFFFGS